MSKPPRLPWISFADAIILAEESRTRLHPEYPDAKAKGNAVAAANLASSLVDQVSINRIHKLIAEVTVSRDPVLICANAYEQGYNAIPAALSEHIKEHFGLQFETRVVQTNVVHHTGADGYGRLARQAAFAGEIRPKREYVMVDDFIGQGGTLANLRGWIETQGGKVVGAVALTGKSYSAKLNPNQEQLHELRKKHGSDLEHWWENVFGHTLDCLTYSEARYLTRSPDADTIRNRITAAMR